MHETQNVVVCLPYFHDLAQKFSAVAQRKVRQRSRQGILAEIGNHRISEGTRTRLQRTDSGDLDSQLNKVTAEFSANWTDLENLNRDYVEKVIDDLAKQFKEKITKSLIELMKDTTDKTGNVLDSGGKPMSAETLLELQRMMPALSDPRNPSNVLLVHPDMIPRLHEIQREFDQSPELQKKFAEIQAQKYEEFRSDQLDRELAG